MIYKIYIESDKFHSAIWITRLVQNKCRDMIYIFGLYKNHH